MTDARARQSGISLVETLIALFIIALLSTAGGVMLIQSLRGSRLVEEHGMQAREIQTAFSMLRDDFAAFVPRASRADGSADQAALFEGHAVRFDGRIVTFVRNGWANPGEHPRGDLQRVEYRFDGGALVRRSWNTPDAAPGSRISDQTLIADLQDVTVRYGASDTWRNDWIVPASSQDQTTPDKIELTFRFGEADEMTARFRIGKRL